MPFELEDLGCAFQRLVHTPGQWNADKKPEQRRFDIESAPADAKRSALHSARALGAGLKLGNLLSAHVPFRIDRLYQVVADETRRQHRTQDVHGGVVELIARNAGSKLEFADVVHDHRTDD